MKLKRRILTALMTMALLTVLTTVSAFATGTDDGPAWTLWKDGTAADAVTIIHSYSDSNVVEIEVRDGDDLFEGNSFSTSNIDVAEANWQDYEKTIAINCYKVGSAVITVTDKNGKSRDIAVTVEAPSWELSKSTISLTLTNRNDYIDIVRKDGQTGALFDDDNSITCSNESVARVVWDRCDVRLGVESYKPGTVTATIKDKYGNSRTVTIKVVCNHKFEGWERIKTPTQTAAGMDTRICDLCGYTETRSVDMLPRMILSKTSFTWNNKVQTPAVAVKVGNQTLPKSCYTVTLPKGRKNIGTYTIKVTLKNGYTGTRAASYTIVPKGTKLSSVKSAKKAATVKWDRQASKMPKTRIKGYQIQYSLRKDFKSGNKTVTVGGYNKNSRKITNLASNKTYYFRVRTYMKVGKKNYYSGWSAIKSAKIPSAAKAKTSASAARSSGKVYWTPNGSVYHLNRNCSTLSRSKTVYSGTVSQSGKPRACKVCN